MNVTVSLLHEPSRKRPWIVRWWGNPDSDTGKQKRYGRVFKYSHEAKAFEAEKRTSHNRGEPRDPVNVTLEELVADFEEARVSSLSYKSKIGYENTTKQLLVYFGKKRKVRDIGRREAEAFIATRKRVCNGESDLSSWAKTRHLIHARSIFTAAKVWGYMDDNPFRADKLAGRSALNQNPKGKPWQHLTPEDFRKMLSEVTSPQKRAAYWLMYGCGMRAGEAYNMRTENIDLKARRVHIRNRAATAEVSPFTLKAEGQSVESKERSVPIPEAALPDIIAAMKVAFRAGGFVVLTEQRFQTVQAHWQMCYAKEGWRGHAWRPWQSFDMMNNMIRDTKTFLDRAGVELTAPFTLHTFRKSFAQNHADAGTPPRTLAKLLGHTNTRVTMQFYNRVTDANERAASDVMNDILKTAGTVGVAVCRSTSLPHQRQRSGS